MKQVIILWALCAFCPFLTFAQQTYTVESPDGKVKANILLNEKISYSVSHKADQLIAPSPISMTLVGGEQLGANPKLKNKETNSVNQTIEAPFYKRKQVTDHYNELVLNFRNDYSLIFRAYNDGVAYRFATTKKDSIKIAAEEVTFNFPEDFQAFVPYVNKEMPASFETQFWNSFENTYTPHRPFTAGCPKAEFPAPAGRSGQRKKNVHHRGRPGRLSGLCTCTTPMERKTLKAYCLLTPKKKNRVGITICRCL